MDIIDCALGKDDSWQVISIEFLGVFAISLLGCFLLCFWVVRDIAHSRVNGLTWFIIVLFPILSLFGGTMLELTAQIVPDGKCKDFSIAFIKTLQKTIEVFFIGVILATFSALISYKVDKKRARTMAERTTEKLFHRNEVIKMAMICGLATMFGNSLVVLFAYWLIR